MSDYRGIRKEYQKGILKLEEVSENPFVLFKKWMDQAMQADVADPTAMVLSTVSLDGKPSSRVVLLKEMTETGFVFYTNYQSQKGVELANNPVGAIVFFWPELERQIRISGGVRKTDRKTSEAYFNSRPLESRINAIISPQSQPIASHDELVQKQKLLKKEFESGDKIPDCPENWGGYELTPDEFEFWQGGPARLNSRIKFVQDESNWVKKLLAP